MLLKSYKHLLLVVLHDWQGLPRPQGKLVQVETLFLLHSEDEERETEAPKSTHDLRNSFTILKKTENEKPKKSL